MPRGMDWLARRIAELDRDVKAISTQPQLGTSSIEDGAVNEYDGDGQIVSRTGTQHDGTHGSQILSGPVPPVPSAPVVEPVISGLKVRWDGLFEGGETVPAPMDFARVEVHASTEVGFTPVTADTLLGTIETPRGAELTLALPPVAHEVAFVARALSGKASASSAHATGTPIAFDAAVGELGLGTKIYYGPDTPVDATEGELWYHETSPGSGQYTVQRLLDGEWVDLELDAVTDAVAQAVAAQATADAKVKTYVQPDAPTGDLTVGDLWMDDNDGHKLYTWDGDSWEPRALGNGAIAPQSLIASNVVATGTITGALIEAGAITADKMEAGTITAESGVIANAAIGDAQISNLSAGKLTAGTIGAGLLIAGYIATAETGARVSLSSGGLRAYDSTGSRTVDIAATGDAELSGTVNSTNYESSNAGYYFSENRAQVPTLNCLGALGAQEVNTAGLIVDGIDFNDLLDVAPRGVVAFGQIGGETGRVNTATTSGTTLLGMIEIAAGPLEAGRLYKISSHFHAEGTVAEDAFDWRLNYTVNGSQPTTTSNVVDGSLTRWVVPQITSDHVFIETFYAPNNTYDTVRFLLTVGRVGTGSGGVFIYLLDPNRRFSFAIEDVGRASAISAAGVQQRSVASGSPDPAPSITRTKSWPITWCRTYIGTLVPDSPEDPDIYAYQGQFSTNKGNNRSLMGLDYADIMATLSGATINAISVTFRVQHEGGSAGIDPVNIAEHNYTAKPATWNAANVTQNVASRDNCFEGQTYTVDLDPATSGARFKSGASKGIGFGPCEHTNLGGYGYMYGFGTDTPPTLNITYTK